jgi:uncharacterized membrane protein YoaK (UPF0700 family)
MALRLLAILALSSAAGAMDAVAYFELGRTFVANMTGNTVLAAGAMVLGKWAEAGHRLATILAFFLGIAGARVVVARPGPPQRDPSPRRAAACLLASAGLVMLSAFLTAVLHEALAPLLAFCLGAQNAVLTRLGPVTFNTSFITGDLEKLGEAVAQFGKGDAASGHPGLQAGLAAAIWLSYLFGAAVGVALSRPLHAKALFLPALLLLGAAASFAMGRFRYRGQPNGRA